MIAHGYKTNEIMLLHCISHFIKISVYERIILNSKLTFIILVILRKCIKNIVHYTENILMEQHQYWRNTRFA